MIVVLQLIFLIGQLRDLIQRAEIGGHHQHRKTVEREILRADLDHEMFFLTGKSEEQDRPQVADQLYLGAGGVQGQDVVLVEQAHHFQRVIVFRIFGCRLPGNGIHVDLDHAGLTRQIFRLRRHAVQFVADGDGPGQLLEGFVRLAFEIEVAGRIFSETEHVGSAFFGRRRSIRQIIDGVVFAVIRNGIDTV